MLLTAGGAASVFIGGMTGFPTPFILDLVLSGGLATATAFGLWMVIPNKTSDLLPPVAIPNSSTGVAMTEVYHAIRLGTEQLAEIRKNNKDIRSPNTKRRIEKICCIGDKIIEDFRLDPKDIREGRAWLNSYLPQFNDVVRDYVNLSRTGARNLKAQESMARFDETLNVLEESFEKLLTRLTENDTMSLDVNQDVLKTMVKNEGM
jgi:hypothetical protein